MVVDYKKWVGVGAGVGVISLGLAWLWKTIFGVAGAGSVTFATLDVNVRQQIESGVDTSIGTQVLNVFGGNFSGIAGGMLGVLLIAVIGAVLTVLIGRFIYEFAKNLYEPKTSQGRLVAVLLYGSIVLGWVISLMTGAGSKIPALNAVVAIVIYFFIVAIVYGWLSRIEAIGRYFQVPQ